MDQPAATTSLNIKTPEIIRETLTVLGIVQGVGMRPFVTRLADRFGLTGSVHNAGAHLVIDAAGTAHQLEQLRHALLRDAPQAARIVRLSSIIGQVPSSGWPTGFVIRDSVPAAGLVLISPDLAICPECQRELLDPDNRRFDHALISCMHCGPRYSVLQALPYDRPRTTLHDFPLCPTCQAEYESRQDRRYHAQTISCPDCGPQISFGSLKGRPALDMAIRILHNGGVIAAKGIGGYHLVCRPDLGFAVKRLRRIKRRETKPFAVIFPDLKTLGQYAALAETEARQLESPARPIVLVRPRQNSTVESFDPAVSAGSSLLGAFLPATPLQVLLTGRLGPLVMTSANLSGEMICIDDAEMAEFAAQNGIDGVLANDRPIETGLDDSVLLMTNEQPIMIRRARGYVPLPIDLQDNRINTNLELIAAGSDLKATFALVKDGLCYPGAPVGDLAEQAVLETWQLQLDHLVRLLGSRPARLVIDSHPNYLSATLIRRRFPEVPVLSVQHHHAHIASVLAENPGFDHVLGVAFDGTGFGLDGTIWGGEWLVCQSASMERAAHLRSIPMAGGDQARKRAWQSLACHLTAAGLRGSELINAAPCLQQRPQETAILEAACSRRIGTVQSSSMGSLFDAVCALLGFGDTNEYEGACGQFLEQAAAEAASLSLPEVLPEADFGRHYSDDGIIQLDAGPLLLALAAARQSGTDPRSLALKFHDALAGQIGEICLAICQKRQIEAVALSGGCFQNVILLERSVQLLRQHGLTVLTNRQVSPGDGGLALGQAWLGLRLRLDPGHSNCTPMEE